MTAGFSTTTAKPTCWASEPHRQLEIPAERSSSAADIKHSRCGWKKPTFKLYDHHYARREAGHTREAGNRRATVRPDPGSGARARREARRRLDRRAHPDDQGEPHLSREQPDAP